ncbi:MAG: S-layer homology domain-containing protein [Bacillota bacterium]|nr:S-layer homology domain-containing protein [Bacillota bacterium]
MNWAQENEVVEGYSDTIYAPFDDVTREQMVTMMYRYAAVTGKDITVNGLDGLNRFKDGDKVADWAQEAMAWAVEQGII